MILCHTYEWGTWHTYKWYCVTHMNDTVSHIWTWYSWHGVSHIWMKHMSHISMIQMSHIWMIYTSHIWMIHRLMPRIRMSRAKGYTCHTYEWNTCHTYEWNTCHTYKWCCVTHMNETHVTYMNETHITHMNDTQTYVTYTNASCYGVALINRLLKIIGLFCRISCLL